MANILLVDDDEEIRDAVAACLELEGHFVTVARNGEEAWHLLLASAGNYDLLITDLRMPVCDGRTLVKRLRASETRMRLPCLVLSAEMDPTLGADAAFLRKPFGVEELLGAAEALLATCPVPARAGK